MKQQQSLYIIDGMSLLFRSFYAMGTRLTNPQGIPIGAVYGFLKIVLKILKEQNPTHFAVCWDLKVKTFRHEVYPAYKANRGEPPPEIIPQIDLIKEAVINIGIPSFAVPGFEADDLVASLAKFFENYGSVFIVSSDKDFMQLVNHNIRLFSLKKGDDYDILGSEKVVDYFGVPPESVIDALALMGDKVDNVPGVYGIGEKGAAKIINEFGTLENLYANLDKVTNKKIKAALEENKDNAFLSKYLVTINSAVPLNVSESTLRFTFADLKTGNTLLELQKANMQSLIKQLFPQGNNQEEAPNKKVLVHGSNAPALSQEEAPNNETLSQGNTPSVQENSAQNDWGIENYRLVLTWAEVVQVCEKITSAPYFAFDTETTGLDTLEDTPIGFSVCFAPGEAYYIPAFGEQSISCFDVHEVLDFSPQDAWMLLKESLQKRTGLLVGHNLKYDLHMLANVNVTAGNAPIACTMVAAWLLNPVMQGGFSLDSLTLHLLGFKKIPTSALIGKETGRSSMREVPLRELSRYACEDVDATLRLWLLFCKNLTQEKALEKLFWDMEMPVLRILLNMERQGVHIDAQYLGHLGREVQLRLAEIEKDIFAQVGFSFKLSSPKQLGEVLFEKLKIHEVLNFTGKLARTTLGYKTDADVLEKFSEHPLVALVQEFRELSKLLSTYILVLPTLVKKSTNRVHTHFNQIGTATGRLSSSEPNLQNIPIRTAWGKKVRAAFSATSETTTIISADYSQIELRVLAHLSQDPSMLSAFRSGVDIHRKSAADIMGKPLAEVSAEERSRAKAINFGIVYGMGPQRLAKEQKISFADAKNFIEKYFMNFSKVKEYLDNQRRQAHATGMACTYFGRIRPLPEMQSSDQNMARLAENMAINSPVQGTAADIMKFGMIKVHQALTQKNLRSKIILQVHDELVFEGPCEEQEIVEALVKKEMEQAVEFLIPLIVEVEHGRNWLEAK